MRTQPNARGLVAFTMLGFLAAAPFMACGGDDSVTTTGSTGTTGTGGAGGMMSACNNNGAREGGEECDDGNMVAGDGCEADCTFTCSQGVKGSGDEKCSDGDVCNGDETCMADHTCAAGTPAPDNTDCGAGKVCKMGVCGDIACGDGVVTPPEDCDDGNATDGDGCDNSCLFSCTADADCAPADACAGNATCDMAAHTCTMGTPLPDDSPCATGFCLGGVCTPAVCGDGTMAPNESCDDGNMIDADGCDSDCTYSCVSPSLDCAAAPVCQMGACDANHVCAPVADPAQEGMQCGTNSACVNGNCVVSTCGNGVVEFGEQCDFGMANGPGKGCEVTCQFSCTKAPDSCLDANDCNGTEACKDIMVNGNLGQACTPGTPLAACAACSGGICVNGTCAAASCGDNCVTGNEQCDPPGPNCSNTCTNIICGNGIREGNEECDDGGLDNLDGCDKVCKFEQSHRANWLKMQFGTDSYCTANQLGSAITPFAQGTLQAALDTNVTNGSISILMKYMGLDDLTGTDDPALELGVMNGLPQMGQTPYNGNGDLDWWYTPDPLQIDANRDPIAKLPASIAAHVLTAGPGKITIKITIATIPASLKLADVKFTIDLKLTSPPLMSAFYPPGHLAYENLDPALVSFDAGGDQDLNGAGKLCGNVIAISLDQVPVPPELQPGGTVPCNEGYTSTNTLLDVIVGGCVVLGNTTAIISRQPDQVDSTAPQPGAGPPYTLTRTGNDVTGCLDANNQPVNFLDCLNAAAYSAYFKLATGRVIVK